MHVYESTVHPLREPVPVHIAALHEPIPAQRLCHGPEGGRGDYTGLRQR